MKLFLCTVLCCSFLYIHAQQKPTSGLTGIITDAKTRLPLEGATINLIDYRLQTSTDSSGKYSLNQIPAGHLLLEISFAGYRTLIEHIDISGQMSRNFLLSPSVIENEGITVTATGTPTSIKKMPAAFTRLKKDDLLSVSSTNIIDALSKQPGISQLSTGPAIAKPVIRGLGFNRVVVINDGIRQEGQQWGDEHGIETDEGSVNRIEIVKGPASLIYGSDALAGVINIITAMPQPLNSSGGSVYSSYSTNNKLRTVFAEYGENKNRIRWNTWGSYKAAADYKNKFDGRVWNSKFNEKNFGGFAGVSGSKGYSNIIFSRFDQTTGLIEGDRDSSGNFLKTLAGGSQVPVTENDFNSIVPSVPYQHIVHTRIIADNSYKIGNNRLTATIGFQRNERLEFGNADLPKEAGLSFLLETINYSAAFHFKERRGWHSSIGINGMIQENTNKGNETIIPEYRLMDIGGYFYTQKTFLNTTLSGGIRMDNRKLRSYELMEDNQVKSPYFEKEFNNISASAGITHNLSHEFLIKFNMAKGFRAPSIPELASNGAHEGTNRFEYGNRDLLSERSFQADAGFELNTEHVLLTGSLFYNNIRNFIFFRKLSGIAGDSLVEADGEMIPAFTFSQRNAVLKGFEISMDLHPHPFDWVHWENSISYVRGTFSDNQPGSKNIPFMPAGRWVSELKSEILRKNRYFKKLTLHLEADHTFRQQKIYSDFNTETATAGYTLLNADISSDIMHRSKKLFSVYIIGSNLSNIAYQSHLSRLKYTDVNLQTGRSGIFNMGRNIQFKINVPIGRNKKTPPGGV